MEICREVNLMEFSDDVIRTAKIHIKDVDADLARRVPAAEKEALHRKRECYLRIINAADQMQNALSDLQSVTYARIESRANQGGTKGKAQSVKRAPRS